MKNKEWSKKEWKEYWERQKAATRKQIAEIEAVWEQKRQSAMHSEQIDPHFQHLDLTAGNWNPDANHHTNLT